MSSLSYDFTPYSPRSRKLWQFEDAGAGGLLGQEVQRTRAEVARQTAERERKGQLDPDASRRICRTWLAIGEDLEARGRRDPDGPTIAEQLVALREQHGVAWVDKVRALRAEIERRRRDYPADVDKGRLTPAAARAQLEALEAVHFLYCHQGFAFDGTRDELRAHNERQLDALEQQQAAA